MIKITMQDGIIHNCTSDKIENALLECGLIKEPMSWEEAIYWIWPLESGIKHIEYDDDTEFEIRLAEWRKQ